MLNIKANAILIIDFGSQYTQLIARRIREIGVYCEIHPFTLEKKIFNALNPCGIILSGGPSTVTELQNPRAPAWVFECKLPVLGICYGMQTMAIQLQGEVACSAVREFGYAKLHLTKTSNLLSNLDEQDLDSLDVWMSHGDKVTQVPPGFEVIGATDNAAIAAMAHQTYHWYGLQFHPEVTHTPHGLAILKRFVLDICQASKTWNVHNIAEQFIEEIRLKVGKDKVLLGLSGGVDSAVVAALLHKAIGEQLLCVFVDTGLLRLNEAANVLDMFADYPNFNIIHIKSQVQFLQALQGIECPEEKRKIIGHTFIEVFEQEAQKHPEVKWLAQGTIYPDVIESAAVGTNGSVVIKSHHNVGGLPETLNLKLLEPIRALFKDEVRKLGLELSLPYEMVYRHPFPGPGLGVRILGEIKAYYITILQKADAIFIEELKKHDLYHKVSQAFAVFLPVKSVGVMGDGRRYDYVICLRAVQTIDFMTAHWAELPWSFLSHISNRIINEVDGISRVTYDISGKPPATIEWE